ncbi:LapA family protein [Caloranaerobacter ferrireducens]|uniref:LapA family protein n=1 Tax=Caloranaerobacter ferrireducens TaxID=1323370 RepID=UPI00084DC8FE|nr:LapA family protein [Caloranaerobacter ferrireducens]
MEIGFIFSLIFAILVAVFALKNADSVMIDFFFAKVQVSQAIVIFVSAALGAVIVTILGLVRQLKLTLKIKEQVRKIKKLEEEKTLLESRIEEIISEKDLKLETDSEVSNKENEIEKINSEENNDKNEIIDNE